MYWLNGLVMNVSHSEWKGGSPMHKPFQTMTPFITYNGISLMLISTFYFLKWGCGSMYRYILFSAMTNSFKKRK